MKIFTFANQKGGVGKTSTVYGLSSILAERGYRVLTIDMDPRADLTSSFSCQTNFFLVGSLYQKEPLQITKEIPIGKGKIDFVSSHKNLHNLDLAIISEPDKDFRLKEAFEKINQSKYDYVLIDVPPGNLLLLMNALVASEFVISPTQISAFAVNGLVELSDSIRSIRRNQNSKLKYAGILPVVYEANTRLAKSFEIDVHELEEKLVTKVFKTRIRKCQDIPNSQAEKKLLTDLNRSSNAYTDYSAFADEIIKIK